MCLIAIQAGLHDKINLSYHAEALCRYLCTSCIYNTQPWSSAVDVLMGT